MQHFTLPTHRLSFMKKTVSLPPRPGDQTNIDRFERFAPPGLVGKLMLEYFIGNKAGAQNLYWPNLQDLKCRARHLEGVGNDLRHHDIVYPDYFLKEFHGYNSNFSELSVAQQAPAMAIIPAIMRDINLNDAFTLRLNKLKKAIACYKTRQGHDADTCSIIVDMCCGSGVSTRVLAREYPFASVVGVDMCWPMLREAKAITDKTRDAFTIKELEQLLLDDDSNDIRHRLHWLHDNAECTRLASDSVDLVTIHWAAHELPETAIRNIACEAMRVLKPGGWFAVIDKDQDTLNLKNGAENMPWVTKYLRRVVGTIVCGTTLA